MQQMKAVNIHPSEDCAKILIYEESSDYGK